LLSFVLMADVAGPAAFDDGAGVPSAVAATAGLAREAMSAAVAAAVRTGRMRLVSPVRLLPALRRQRV
jgi:hypothetical protein